MDAELPETIGFLPRRRFVILPVPPALVPIYTGGRWRSRNLHDGHLRPAVAAALHADRAHHPRMQPRPQLPGGGRAGSDPPPGVPPRHRLFGLWRGLGALLWEWMGSKLGMYETPYEDFGRLSYEMRRASRLVIDTGIHHYGWSRQQAQDYLRGNTALSEHEIPTEIDRYIALAGTGAGVQARRDADPPQARRGRSRARRQVRPAQLSAMRSSRWVRCRCPCSKRGSTSSSPMAGSTRRGFNPARCPRSSARRKIHLILTAGATAAMRSPSFFGCCRSTLVGFGVKRAASGRSMFVFRHPGLDPGSTAAPKLMDPGSSLASHVSR